jgi:hypothetical protein
MQGATVQLEVGDEESRVRVSQLLDRNVPYLALRVDQFDLVKGFAGTAQPAFEGC